ncbi:MAG: hypothetical protein JO292_04680, partial [Betaproteobacteria bacterium]|nr:hypothetical protein [Betaproteobacteria bacterium]
VFRGATVSRREIDAVRTIEAVIRARRVHAIGRRMLATDLGDLPGGANELYVDCTAAGVPPSPARPVYEDARVTIQYVGVGFLPWSAATIGFVESTGLDMDEKNRLCPPVAFTGDVADLLELVHAAMRGQVARARHETVGPWNLASRLNPALAAVDHLDQPDVAQSLIYIVEHTRDALEHLERVLNGPASRKVT